MSTIRKLQSRPEHHRRAVALVASGAVTLVIAGAWAFTLPLRFNVLTQERDQQEAAVEAASAADSSNLSVMTQALDQQEGVTDSSDPSQTAATGDDTDTSDTGDTSQTTSTDQPQNNVPVFDMDGVLISNPSNTSSQSNTVAQPSDSSGSNSDSDASDDGSQYSQGMSPAPINQ
jgi:hypothetical protein